VRLIIFILVDLLGIWVDYSYFSIYEGRSNYTKANFAEYSNLDIISSDKLAAQVATNLELNVLASLWYWFKGEKSAAIQKYVKAENYYWISVKVNGWRVQKHPYYKDSSNGFRNLNEKTHINLYFSIRDISIPEYTG